jgi:hypothetical protein
VTFDLSNFDNTTIQFSNNCYFNTDNSPNDPEAIIADPKLVAPGSGSVDGYRLLSDSPCINVGAAINDGGNADYWSNPAPIGARDVGAHEFQPANGPPARPQIFVLSG